MRARAEKQRDWWEQGGGTKREIIVAKKQKEGKVAVGDKERGNGGKPRETGRVRGRQRGRGTE